jgi:hypothetical protein
VGTPNPFHFISNAKFGNSEAEGSCFCITLEMCGCERRFYLLKATTWYRYKREKTLKSVRGVRGTVKVGESPYLTSGQLTATNVVRPGVTRRTNKLMLKLRERKSTSGRGKDGKMWIES